jgi:signal peptidase II
MKKLYLIIITALVIVVDRISKYLILKYLGQGTVISLLPGLNLQLAFNHGVAFSLFYHTGSESPWILVSITAVMCCVILFMLCRTSTKFICQQMALSFILAGAISNIIDRIYYGAVIDFIDIYIKQYHWPIFNFADSFICIGAILLIWKSGKDEKEFCSISPSKREQ